MPSKKKPTKKGLQRVTVRAELRDEPDWDKFAYALLQFVKLQSAQKGQTKRSPRKPRSNP